MRELEAAGRSEDLEAASSYVGRVESEFKRVEQALRQMVS